MTKKDIFKEIYLGNYQRFIDSFMNKIETVVGFTDQQKLSIISEIIEKKSIHKRDAKAFYLDFSDAKQNLMLGIIDNILLEDETRIQSELNDIIAKRIILAS